MKSARRKKQFWVQLVLVPTVLQKFHAAFYIGLKLGHTSSGDK